jgi:hypothetical protein
LSLAVLVGPTFLGTARADLTPIGLTGWNQDLIAESSAASPQAGASTAEAFNWVWYEQGAPNTTQGLPASGSFVSQYNPNVTFQFQPYTGYNTLYYPGGGVGALTLTTPQAFSSLAFLVSNQGGGSFTATLNFSDSSTYTLAVASDPDWTTSGASNVALANTGVVQDDSTWPANYNGTLSLFEHDFTLPTSDASKTLDSIEFTTAGNEVIFGVSGPDAFATATPEPASLGLLGLGLTSLIVAVRRRKSA